MIRVEKLPQSDLYNVSFVFSAQIGHQVFLTGSFCDWDPAKLLMEYQKSANGFCFELQLPAGYYEYKFVVDGEWITDLDNTGFSANDFGTLNSVLNIG